MPETLEQPKESSKRMAIDTLVGWGRVEVESNFGTFVLGEVVK